MASPLTPDKTVPSADEALLAMQKSFEPVRRASAYLLENAMATAVQQVERGQLAMRESLRDFSTLTQARTPEALVSAELAIFRRRWESAVAESQLLHESLRQHWREMWPFAPAGPPEVAERKTGNQRR